MNVFVLFELAASIVAIAMFAIMVYQRVEKRKKLKTSIAVTIFVILAIIISLYFNITFCKTFEINKFISAFLISISGSMTVLSMFLLILSKLEKRKTNVNNSSEEQEANEFVEEIYGKMYTDKNRSKRL